MSGISETVASISYNKFENWLRPNEDAEREAGEVTSFGGEGRAKMGDDRHDVSSGASRSDIQGRPAHSVRESGASEEGSRLTAMTPDLKGRVKCLALLVASVGVIAVDGTFGCVYTVVSLATLVLGQVVPRFGNSWFVNNAESSFTSVGFNFQRVFTHLFGVIEPKLDILSKLALRDDSITLADVLESRDTTVATAGNVRRIATAAVEARMSSIQNQVIPATIKAATTNTKLLVVEGAIEARFREVEASASPSSLGGDSGYARSAKPSPAHASRRGSHASRRGRPAPQLIGNIDPSVFQIPHFPPAGRVRRRGEYNSALAAKAASNFKSDPTQLTAPVSMVFAHAIDLVSATICVAKVVISLVTDRLPAPIYKLAHGYEYCSRRSTRREEAMNQLFSRMQLGYIFLDVFRLVRGASASLLSVEPFPVVRGGGVGRSHSSRAGAAAYSIQGGEDSD